MATQDIRDIVVAFRVTSTEAAHIDAAGQALRHPRARADYCRAAALHLARQRVPEPAKPVRRPPRRLPALDTRLLGQLLAQTGKLGSNVNQLATAANATGAVPATEILAVAAVEIRGIRQALTAALGANDEAAA
jgi:hypothetical protein